MAKHVIETITIFRNTYYVDVEDPGWGSDSVVMKELEPFSSEFKDEIILATQTMDEGKDWPTAPYNTVNAATYTFDYNNDGFTMNTRWDLEEPSTKIPVEK